MTTRFSNFDWWSLIAIILATLIGVPWLYLGLEKLWHAGEPSGIIITLTIIIVTAPTLLLAIALALVASARGRRRWGPRIAFGMCAFDLVLAVAVIGLPTERSLIHAVYRGDHAAVRRALWFGIDPDTTYSRWGWHRRCKGGTPMTIAAANGDIEILALLVSYGAEVDHFDGFRCTPLMAAAQKGRLRAVDWLIAHGADPLIKSDEGTALSSAIGHPEVMKRLLLAGVPVDLPDQRGRTALYYAATARYHDAMQLLLERGADPNHEDRFGHVPMDRVNEQLGQRKRDHQFITEQGRGSPEESAAALAPLERAAEILKQYGAELPDNDVRGGRRRTERVGWVNLHITPHARTRRRASPLTLRTSTRW